MSEQARGPSKERLAQAAEALVKAASNELKNSVEANLETLKQSVEASQEHIVRLQNDLREIKNILGDHQQRAKFDHLISCAELGSFQYHDNSVLDSQEKCDSHLLVKHILTSFASGNDYILPDDATFHGTSISIGRSVNKALFRRLLMKQLTRLIGHEPRLVQNEDYTFTVYYS